MTGWMKVAYTVYARTLASNPENAIKNMEVHPGEGEVTLPICQAQGTGSLDPHRGSVT